MDEGEEEEYGGGRESSFGICKHDRDMQLYLV